MKRTLLILLTICLVLGCSIGNHRGKQSILQGAWVLRHVEYPFGLRDDYSIEGSETFCRIYDSDSMMYECRLTRTPSGLVLMPIQRSRITLMDKGGGEVLYLEDGDPHPLIRSSDSTITIQQNGVLYSWVREDNIYKEWGNEICHIIAHETESEKANDQNHYVLSTRERQQANTINWLLYAITFVLFVSAQIIIANYRSKHRMQLQLQQIREEHDERAQTIRQAMIAEEDHFFNSDEYDALQRRMAEGTLMKEQEWQHVEHLLKTLYPGFTSQLRSLYPMSELEYHVCLLIKLRIAPKDIATVMARDVSTISTVRSRLYKKVFGRKGGTKEWDDFILSIAT